LGVGLFYYFIGVFRQTNHNMICHVVQQIGVPNIPNLRIFIQQVTGEVSKLPFDTHFTFEVTAIALC